MKVRLLHTNNVKELEIPNKMVKMHLDQVCEMLKGGIFLTHIHKSV